MVEASESRAPRRAKQQAVVEKEITAAVRSRGDDAPREERRRWLQDALQQRNITRDPIWIEQKLDDLESSGIQRAKRKKDAITDLGKLASSMLRNRQQEPAAPDWMRPPADAQVDVCSPPEASTHTRMACCQRPTIATLHTS